MKSNSTVDSSYEALYKRKLII